MYVHLIYERFWRLPKVSEATSSRSNSLHRSTVSLLNSDLLWDDRWWIESPFCKKVSTLLLSLFIQAGKTFSNSAKLSRNPYRAKDCLCQVFLNHQQFFRTPFALSATTTRTSVFPPPVCSNVGCDFSLSLPAFSLCFCTQSSSPAVFHRSLCEGERFK